MPLCAALDTDFSMNGAVLKEKKNDAEIWRKQDGTVITIYADRSEAALPDGSKIIKFNNGRREITSPDGSKIIVDEAKGVREYSSSAGDKKISFSGMTPFGEKIERVEKKIMKTPQYRLIYLPEKSDEMLYPGKSEENVVIDIQIFFDALYDRTRQKFINDANDKKSLPSKPLDIIVSYCRYCKTGYCFGKNRKVVVEFIENDTVVKTFEMDGLLLREKDKQKDFIKQIVESLGN